jgi:hypothetical protein
MRPEPDRMNCHEADHEIHTLEKLANTIGDQPDERATG